MDIEVTVTSPLNADIVSEVGITAAGSAAYAAEQRKHVKNNPKCKEFGLGLYPLCN